MTCLNRLDERLLFWNLKKSSNHRNIVGHEQRKQIWIPNLVFANSVTNAFVQEDILSTVWIKNQNESPTIALNSDLQKNEEYKGALNPLIFERIYDLQLQCVFSLRCYPFDFQQCYIEVNKKTKFVWSYLSFTVC